MVSIQGLSKAAVLAVLYNASKPQGMGFMHYEPKPMEEAEAATLLKQGTDFDYLKGRVMKIRLKSDEGFEEALYDRDNGRGAAQRAIDSLKRSGEVNDSEVNVTHRRNTEASVGVARQAMHQPTTFTKEGMVTSVSLGLSDVAEPLGKAIDKVFGQN